MTHAIPLLLLLHCLNTPPANTILPLADVTTEPPEESVGFANPDDLDALLAYRLPEWGYRRWEASISGESSGREGQRIGTAHHDFALGSEFFLRSESEDHDFDFSSLINGAFSRATTDHDDDADDSKRTQLAGRWSSLATRSDYFTSSLAWIGLASLSLGFDEQDSEFGSEERTIIQRHFSGRAGLGIGMGRIRDVGPLLKAQRISERLAWLGRRPLGTEEVRALAEHLVQQRGYGALFARPDKIFWADTLATLNLDEPLSPYELLYLLEVLEEDLGWRREGFRVRLMGHVQRLSDWRSETSGGPELGVDWSRNLNLEHQLSISASINYTFAHDDPYATGRSTSAITASHLWALADRVLWTNTLRSTLYYLENDGLRRRDLGFNLSSDFRYFILDRVSLTTLGRVLHVHEDRQHEDRWEWQLSVGLSYTLDRTGS